MFNKILISKSILINNVKQARLKNPNSLICVMAKANAYGLGIKEVANVLNDYVDFWGVACFFEASTLKQYTNKKILIVGPLQKGNINPQFSYACYSIEDIKYLINLDLPLNVHIKVNSGMNRYGVNNIKEFKAMLKLISKSKLKLEGVFTHFATADSYVNKQTKRFNQFVNLAKAKGFNPIIHADNSAVNDLFNHHYDMVRLGFNIYDNNSKEYRLPITIQSTIVQINQLKKGDLAGYNKQFVANKRCKIAVIPLGYADGILPLYIGAELIIQNKRCKIVNVCMDCTLLDVTNIDIKKGTIIDVVNQNNPLKYFANYAHISPYVVMTNFSSIRAERKIVD